MSDSLESILDYSVASLDPRNLLWAARDFLARPAGAFRFFIPGPASLSAWRELQKRAEVFWLVSQVSNLIGRPSSAPLPLPELIERAYALGPFPALWAVEGLGHDYGDSVWKQGRAPRGLLTGPQAATIPAKSLLMMHAGIGLSIAQTLLAPFRPPLANVSRQEIARALTEIVALCRESSRPGYLGPALESIGLVTRTFHPGLVRQAGRVLAELDGEVADFYWHGVGRALYFLAISFLPCGNADWRGFEIAAAEAPDERARGNAVAGLSWAITLVNQQQPEVVAGFLASHGSFVTGNEAFVNGLASAIMMRCDATPEAPFIASFCAYRPRGEAPARLWQEVVANPCRQALEEVYPALRETHRLGEIFRYRSSPRPLAQQAARRGPGPGWAGGRRRRAARLVPKPGGSR